MTTQSELAVANGGELYNHLITSPDAAPGFVPNMPESEYHARPEISKSGLDLVNISPAHYACDAPREPTPAMIVGSAIHKATLEPDLFHETYARAEFKDRRTKAYKEFEAEYGREYTLLPGEYDHVLAVSHAVQKHPVAGRLIMKRGHFEISGFATDPETGVNVRCRYDFLGSNMAVDLKKSRDVLPRGFQRAVSSYRYHVQAAFYSDLYYWITKDRIDAFWLIAVEDKPPYTVVPYVLDDLAIEAGRRAYRENLNTYAACLESGDWPTFEPECPYISLPDWAFAEMDEELEI